MKKIYNNESVCAIFHKSSDWKEGLSFLTPNETFIQVGTWWYRAGKSLTPHIHIRNERLIERTQEAIVVMSGKCELVYTMKKGTFFIRRN